MHWLAHLLGLTNGSGQPYLFWSGFGSDLAEFALVAAAWRLVNCHEPACWRIGAFPTIETNGHHFRRCHRHHNQRHQRSLP